MKQINFKIIIVTMIVSIVLFVMPLPYYIEMPGTAEDLKEHVEVNGEKDPNKGSYMLTTVGIQRATPFSFMLSYFNPLHEIVSKKEMMGSSSSKEYDQMQDYYMKTSQNLASKVALDLVDKPYEIDYQGIYVMSVNEKSDFYGKLEVGDTVSKLDGKKIPSSQELIDTIKSKQVGDKVTLTVLDDNKTKDITGTLIEMEETKLPGIGISLVDHTELVSDDTITFKTDGIGGPSAGLMFTLELYTLLSDKDLRQNLNIAGTGTINADGQVGRIGGIDKKVVAAENAGADIFFAPNDEISEEMKEKYPDIKTNYEEALESAKKNKLDLKIVPVKTVKDAVEYLEKRK